MSDSVDVVVVIPAFNAGPSLGSALASVAAQTAVPAEVVVVDDASDDDTIAVARAWERVLPLRVIALPTNQGPAAARREAIQASTSAAIALLDADDYWFPNHLEVLLAAFRGRGWLVSGDGYHWRPPAGITRRSHRQVLRIPELGAQFDRILDANFVFVGCVFDRCDYVEAGGFRDGVSGAEDWDLWIRMLRNGVRVVGTTAVTCLYRVAGGSLTQRPEIHETYLRVIDLAQQDAQSDYERAVIDDAVTNFRARLELAAAREAARAGNRSEARRRARAALDGTIETRVEAMACMLAPMSLTRTFSRFRRNYR